MRKSRIFAAISAVAMLMTAVSCSSQGSAQGELIPPAAVCGDEVIEVPMGFIPVSGELDRSRISAMCKAAGRKNSAGELDSVWFGENITGVGLAAAVYFGKAPEKLSDDQWEMLCKVAAEPEKFAGILAGEYGDSVFSHHAYQASRIPQSAYFDGMIEQVVRDRCEAEGCSREEAIRFIYSGGIRIETPYSPEIQGAVDEVYSDDLSFQPNGEPDFPQSAFAVLRDDGGVCAVSGGNKGNTVYNRAFRIPHKIGSAIKPIGIYAPALEKGLIHFSSAVLDEQLNLMGDVKWPNNYDGVYEGYITVTKALRTSKNTVPVRLSDEIGVWNCIDFLRYNLCLGTITDRDATASGVALGDLEEGVPLTDLAAAYVMFINGGKYCAPRFYDRVLDKDGNVVLEAPVNTHQAISSENAWIMNRLLYYNVNTPDCIAGGAALGNGVEVIGKTGTVVNSLNEDSGRLFAGAIPGYTAAVWLGFDDTSASIQRRNYTPPTEIWKNVMEHVQVAEKSFSPDPNVIEINYCTLTGGIAGRDCPAVEKGFYTEGNVPGRCRVH